MFTDLLRKTGLAILLLSLLGQSLQSVAMVCPMDHDQTMPNSVQEPVMPCHMSDSSDSQTQSKQANPLNMDCCDSDCTCPANACTSLGLGFSNLNSGSSNFHETSQCFMTFVLSPPHNKSLYRPPIFS